MGIYQSVDEHQDQAKRKVVEPLEEVRFDRHRRGKSDEDGVLGDVAKKVGRGPLKRRHLRDFQS